MNFKNWFKFQEEMTSTANVAHFAARVPIGSVVRRGVKKRRYRVPQIEENEFFQGHKLYGNRPHGPMASDGKIMGHSIGTVERRPEGSWQSTNNVFPKTRTGTGGKLNILKDNNDGTIDVQCLSCSYVWKTNTNLLPNVQCVNCRSQLST